MKKKESNKNDKILTSEPTTGSTATSASSNITIESADSLNDNASLFPNSSGEKKWASKTSPTVDHDDAR
ncbi:MAG: hypothetical protein K0R54_4445 [Clostridiaceae bacterium]|nr:hypothetical protein [Clostridiaceae bacterium]